MVNVRWKEDCLIECRWSVGRVSCERRVSASSRSLVGKDRMRCDSMEVADGLTGSRFLKDDKINNSAVLAIGGMDCINSTSDSKYKSGHRV